jgi:hypothetical protein
VVCSDGAQSDACDTGAKPGDSADAVDPNAPVIESASVQCYLHETGDKYYQWSALATASDPQGNNTISTTGTIDVRTEGGVVATTTLVCDTDGGCFASWIEGQIDVVCLEADKYEFDFTVTDDNGHESAVVTVVAEQTTEG